MMARLVASSRVLLDMRPLQGPRPPRAAVSSPLALLGGWIAAPRSTAADAARFGGVDAKRVRVVHEAPGEVFKRSARAAERVKGRWEIEPGYLLFVGALDARKDPSSLLLAWTSARVVRPAL